MFDIIPCGRNMVHDEFHRCDSRAKGMSLCDSSSAHSLQCLIFSAIWPLPPQAIGDSSRKKGQEFKGKREKGGVLLGATDPSRLPSERACPLTAWLSQ